MAGTAEQVAGRLAALACAAQGARGCLLTFHRGAPAEVWPGLPDRNFHVNVAFLDELLVFLRRSGWSVVSLDEMLADRRADRPRPLVNFSVDDCYRDTYEHVVPLFRAHGTPVTLFVTTGVPDGTLALAWSGLETIIARRDWVDHGDSTIDTSTLEAKRAAYARLWSALEQAGVDRAYSQLCRANGFDPEAMRREHAITWEMLGELATDPLVEIGGHTITHARISSLSADEARREIAGCRERLEARLKKPIRHFAFPYGRAKDCGPRDFAIARESGFASAATTTKGLFRPGDDVFRLPRNTLNGGHQRTALVSATLSGASGLAAKVMGRV